VWNVIDVLQSIGAGYVLSKEALKSLATELDQNDKDKAYPNCAPSTATGPEDVLMGKCLESVGVQAGDTRDELGRWRFHPFAPQYHLVPHDKHFWFYDYAYYPVKEVSI
jgi:glycoprotein-N-acetylgalactosamine 3-beta-galactosyltransferase